MKTVILCGGQGTRLREETEFRPKPMVEIGGRPVLWHIMKLYAHWGFRDFILALGYRGNMIKEYFLNYDAMMNDVTVTLGKKSRKTLVANHDEDDFEVTLADTGLNVMTGARIKRLQKYVPNGRFMATYGDGLSDLNLQTLMEYHRAHGKLATVSTFQPFTRFGA